MLNIKDFIEIGYISKSHGYRGNVIVKVNDVFPDDIQTIDFVFIEIDGGLVPFMVSEVKSRNNGTAFFQLADIDSDELSDSLVGSNVYFEVKDIPEQVDSSEIDIKGYLLVDKSKGEIGEVTDVLSYKSSDIIQIIINKKELLIPYSAELILSIDDEKQIIVMDLPEGILEIND